MKLIRHGTEPIFSTKQNESVFAPHVQYLNGKYRMDFSHREKGCCLVSFSNDGASWSEPIVTLMPNTESGWEERVNRNYVIFADGIYKMWYTGQQNGRCSIGYAESADGISFTGLLYPVLVAEEECEGCSVMSPCVIYENGKYRMWYSAGKSVEPSVICYAESTDGKSWNRCKNNPILQKNAENAFERDSVGGCRVIRYEGEYLIFYTGYADINTAYICLAHSSDGINGITRYGANPILRPSEHGLNCDSCYNPSVIISSPEDKIMLWYNVRCGKSEEMALATARADTLAPLKMRLKYYVSSFNSNDEELHPSLLKNSEAEQWMREEIPLFECPDKDIERTYYFRFWTYRKHIKKTEDGYVITEFLPQVSWSGEHNAIVAPIGHQLYEGRWLKNSQTYLGEYLKFMLKTQKTAYSYSNWLPYGALKLAEITGIYDYYQEFISDLCAYFEKWEQERMLSEGKCWSEDDNDAMEFSASGTNEEGRMRKGIRPTLNSYMCANAEAISFFARRHGDISLAKKYESKAQKYKDCINNYLWRDGFYRAIHFDEGEKISYRKELSPRELIGYIPWMFKIPEPGREGVFDLLEDPSCFYTEYGLATLEKCSPRYLYEAKHECLWNGYIWPFATSQVLTALYTLIHEYGATEYSTLYLKLLSQYATSHRIKGKNGKDICWIDESMSPIDGDWYSRKILKDWGWPTRKGGCERGKDYNHSTFCDLVLAGLLGIGADGDELAVRPLVLDEWDWFRVEGLYFRGAAYSIIYDKNGTHYGKGKGLTVKKTEP